MNIIDDGDQRILNIKKIIIKKIRKKYGKPKKNEEKIDWLN